MWPLTCTDSSKQANLERSKQFCFWNWSCFCIFGTFYYIYMLLQTFFPSVLLYSAISSKDCTRNDLWRPTKMTVIASGNPGMLCMCESVHVCVYVGACMCVWECACVWMCMCVCMCVCCACTVCVCVCVCACGWEKEGCQKWFHVLSTFTVDCNDYNTRAGVDR